MFLTLQFNKICSGFLLLFTFVFTWTNQSSAQANGDKPTCNLQSLSNKTKIWTGTANLRWYNYYRLTSEGLNEEFNTELDLEFRHLWMTGRSFGWGLQGMTQIYMVNFFGNVGLGNVGFGPLLRVYPWQNKRWHLYLQAGFLIGYDLALSDAFGANRAEGMRYRPGLRAGITYRISDKFGVFLELGPDWEADESFEFDSKALQLDIGIQLFVFNK